MPPEKQHQPLLAFFLLTRICSCHRGKVRVTAAYIEERDTGLQYGEERDNVTEDEGKRNGWEVFWHTARLIYTHTLRYCSIVYSL